MLADPEITVTDVCKSFGISRTMDNDFQPVVGHKFNFRSTPVPNWNGVIDSESSLLNPTKSSPIAGALWGWGASLFGR
jgi:hypothetical protein